MTLLYKNATPEQRNLPVFTNERVASWYENFQKYYSANGNDTCSYFDYASQPLELEARRYAREQTYEYYMAIDEMLNEQNMEP